MSTYQIPGNIKQQYLPFVLKPEASINSAYEESTQIGSAENISPQIFTFRSTKDRDTKKLGYSGCGIINVFPSSYKYMNVDLSLRSLYAEGFNPAHVGAEKEKAQKSLTWQSIFDALPGIQIREYLPDTQLEQCINLFSQILAAVKEIWSERSETIERYTRGRSLLVTDSNGNPVDRARLNPNERRKIEDSTDSGFFEKIQMILDKLQKYLTGENDKQNIFKGVLSKDGKNNIYGLKDLPGAPKSSYYPQSYTDYKFTDRDSLILDVPFMLYYRLLACTTTNIYELPCFMTSKTLYSSDGTHGWNKNAIQLVGDQGSFLSKIPLIGSVLDKLAGNIRINYMPTWNAKEGHGTPHSQIEVKFDLFNDTQEAAMINYIFVQTLVGGNKWIQYGIFQQSPDLYDIKLEGYDRLFACSGKFLVTYDGVLRDPTVNFLSKMARTYGNFSKSKEGKGGNIAREKLLENLRKNKLIKIPDVYHVTMTFESLIPDNFNNFLYTLSENNDVIDRRSEKDVPYYEHAYDSSIIKQALIDPVEGACLFVKAEWEKIKNEENSAYNTAFDAALENKRENMANAK